MAGHWTRDFSFVTGAIREPDLAYVVLSNDQAAQQKIPLAGFVQWEPAGWGDGGQVRWRVAGVTVVRSPLEQMCAVGEFGEVLLLGSGDRHEEKIGKGRNVPKHRGPLRGVRLIGEHVYVVGMGRQVWRRDGLRLWTALDQGAQPRPGDPDVVGFEAVDGFSESDIYAVGWDGEIWRFDGSTWQQIASPVNVVLIDVCCGGDDMVYACARNGVLLRGRGDQWEVLDLDGFAEDLWSLAWYRDRLYLATMDNLFRLGSTGKLELVNTGKDRPRTCYDLVTGQGMLWSIGAKDIVSFDGSAWSRID